MKISKFVIWLMLYSSVAVADDVVIGANLALTGKFAFSGTAQLNGLKLAVEKINREGGINGNTLSLNVEDNGGDPKQAVSSIRLQLGNRGARIFYIGLTHIVQALKGPLTDSGALVVYGAGVAEPAVANRFFFRDWGDAGREGEILARSVSQAKKSSTVYLGEENEACNSLRISYPSSIYSD